MHQFIYFLILFLVLSPPAFAQSVNKIIGQNDLIAVNNDGGNIPFKYQKLLDAFGQTSENCTATHIGHGYVITAGHCFWATADLMEHTACFGTQISWGLRGDKKPYLISQCQEVIAAQRSDAADFAIIRVNPAPNSYIEPDLTRRAAPGDSLTIFSHPDRLPLHWSQLCVVEKTLDPLLSQKKIHHKCDTNPGSSGAALINVDTLKVVGIHDGGYADNGVGMNYGTYIMNSPILEILNGLGFK